MVPKDNFLKSKLRYKQTGLRRTIHNYEIISNLPKILCTRIKVSLQYSLFSLYYMLNSVKTMENKKNGNFVLSNQTFFIKIKHKTCLDGILISYLILHVNMEQITLFFFRNFDICLFHVEKLHLGDVKFCGKNNILHKIQSYIWLQMHLVKIILHV